MTPQKHGTEVQQEISYWVACRISRLYGFRVPVETVLPYNYKFDSLINRKRIEIKCGKIQSYGIWKFNIHRHGKLDESSVDFYVIRLEDVPFVRHNWIHMVIPAPIGVSTLAIGMADLIEGKYARYIDAVHLIIDRKIKL